jgi:hypothetical protein
MTGGLYDDNNPSWECPLTGSRFGHLNFRFWPTFAQVLSCQFTQNPSRRISNPIHAGEGKVIQTIQAGNTRRRMLCHSKIRISMTSKPYRRTTQQIVAQL